jgi:small subunit ribosomal protein S2
MTTLPTFTIKEMIDAGVHYGHKAMRWNPEMAPYIYGVKDGVHILDLQQTANLFYRALQAVQDVAKRQGKILFVGTKRQASEHIAEAAQRCGQFYINKRWLGGILTNWKTVSQSIKTLHELEKSISESESGEGLKLSKKELLDMQRHCQKLENSLGGIREMNGKPDLVFVIDTNKESLAIKEAQKLGIPIVAIIDSNSYPHGIDYIIPGNDDATRAIKLYCQLISDAVLSGVEHSLISSGVDVQEAKEKYSKKSATEEVDQESQVEEEKENPKAKKAVSVLTKAEATAEVKKAVSKKPASTKEKKEPEEKVKKTDTKKSKASEDKSPAKAEKVEKPKKEVKKAASTKKKKEA